MRSVRMMKWLRLAVPGACLVQITACLGPDPEFYLTSLATNAVVSEVISLFFQLLSSGLTAAAGA